MLVSPNLSFGQMDDSFGDYYLFPIKPGIRNTLAGTMGELRRTHFHTGIDIRTGGVQGLPVYAAAAGYISRIAVSPAGYGNALYITHDNGEITVYAHLRNFSEPVRSYVIGEQYKKHSFQVNLFPSQSKFPVQKGDTIAYSGNSGSSSGPHLHFDIRNSDQAVLNPLEYNFEEIIDTRAPEVRRVAFKTMDKNSRVNNQFGRFEFKVRKVGNDYVIDSAIHVYGKIGVELFAFDRQDWTRFRTGITEIVMQVDGQESFKQVIREIPFSKSRNFYNHVNFEQLQERGSRFHKLYVDDGNELDFYTTNTNRGILNFQDECEQFLSIDMYDTYRNKSTVTVNLVCSLPSDPSRDLSVPQMDKSTFEVLDNTLIIYNQSHMENESAVFYSAHSSYLSEAAYSLGDIDVFLWDLKFGLPDSVELCGSKEYFNFDATVPPDQEYEFYSDHLKAGFSKRSIFDTVYLDVKYENDFDDDRELFVFGTLIYPVRSNIEIALLPSKDYPNKDATQVYSVDDAGNFAYVGGEWDGVQIQFKTRSFGRYTLLEDSVPPTIRPLIINSDRIVFRINDKLSGIKSFEAVLDNEWILLNYDPKTSQVWSGKLDEERPFKGPLTMTVIDKAGNESVYQSKIE